MDGVDNLDEKTREDADIRMCPFGCIFLYRGCDAVVMVSWWTSKFFLLSTSLITLRSCGLVVNDRVDGKDNHEDETTEFLNITITSFRMIGFLLLLAGVLLLLFFNLMMTFFSSSNNFMMS